MSDTITIRAAEWQAMRDELHRLRVELLATRRDRDRAEAAVKALNLQLDEMRRRAEARGVCLDVEAA